MLRQPHGQERDAHSVRKMELRLAWGGGGGGGGGGDRTGMYGRSEVGTTPSGLTETSRTKPRETGGRLSAAGKPQFE